MRKTGKFLWLVAYFLSPVILFYFVVDNNILLNQQEPAFFLSAFAGTFAYTWLCYQFILSAQPRFLVNHFSMDKIYRFHGLMGGVSIVLGLIHFLIRRSDQAASQTWGLYALILFALVSGMAVIFLLNTPLRKVKWIENFRHLVEEKVGIKRRYIVLAHNLSLIAATMLFIHVLRSSASQNSAYVRIVMVALYLIGLSFWLYHQFIRRHQLKKSAYQVTENRVENSMVRSLHLKPSQGSVFAYKPGQFTFISVQNGQVSNEPRPYTIASSPSDPNEIEFVIKKPEEFAQQLDLIQPGDEVHVNAPFGVFSYLNYPEEKELVFIAGGIGITPFLSMLRWMKDKDPQRKVILLWGCRFQEDVIKQEEFEAMAAAMPNFTWCPVLSDEAEFKGETGYFDTDKLNRLAVSKIDVQTAGFYVCAPPAMMDIVGVSLEELGVPSKHIHYESFSI